jgi:hypothetical protein
LKQHVEKNEHFPTQQIVQAEGRVSQIIADLGSGENSKIEQ